MAGIDYKKYPILIEPLRAGRPSTNEHTPFGLFCVALANHLAVETNNGKRRPSSRALGCALFALIGHDSLLSKAKLYDSNSSLAKCKTDYRARISTLTKKCTIEARSIYEAKNVNPNPIPKDIKHDDVGSLHVALNYSLSSENQGEDRGWGRTIGRFTTLIDQLRNNPITGKDVFSVAMAYVYDETFGGVTPHATDFSRCIEAACDAMLNPFKPHETLNASLEALKVITMGILYGPKGLDLYASTTDTPEILGGTYVQDCIGFALTQLWGDGSEGDVEGFKGKNTVELRRTHDAGAEYFSPRTAQGRICDRASDPHAYIEPISVGAHEGGGVSRWRIRERENGTTNHTAIRRARDGIVGLLGKQAYELEDGDEIWLAPIIEGEDISPDYEQGAVIRFQKVFDYRYEETDGGEPDDEDEASHQVAEPTTAEDSPEGNAQLKPTGFSLCPIAKETSEPQEAHRQTRLFADIADKNGDFEFTIGREQAVVDFSYGMGDKRVSRGHACIVRSPDGGATLRDGTSQYMWSTNGVEVVRGGVSILVGGRSPRMECPLEDGDTLFFTSRDAPFAVLSFSYVYEQQHHQR